VKLADARAIGEQLIEELSWGCERIEIAGSVRREKPEVKDLELVVLPGMGQRPVGFWESEEYSMFEMAMDEALTRGVLEKDERLVRWGSKYKRARFRNGGQDLVVELFVAQRHTWGYVLALRTGPADFNKIWASHEYHGGCLPLGYRLRDGELWHHGEVVPVEEEEAFFEAIGLPWWPPAERTAERLTAWLKERR
jgi:DNA polymerase/3'-5' exonuclease PolX